MKPPGAMLFQFDFRHRAPKCFNSKSNVVEWKANVWFEDEIILPGLESLLLSQTVHKKLASFEVEVKRHSIFLNACLGLRAGGQVLGWVIMRIGWHRMIRLRPMCSQARCGDLSSRLNNIRAPIISIRALRGIPSTILELPLATIAFFDSTILFLSEMQSWGRNSIRQRA